MAQRALLQLKGTEHHKSRNERHLEGTTSKMS